jgi:N-acetylmuramoyl-L-alanine amidase
MNLLKKEIEQGFPGAALIIVRNGQIIKQTVYGYKLKYDDHEKLLEEPQLLTLDTMFDLASLTKMYATNYALMQMVEQGKSKLTNIYQNTLDAILKTNIVRQD